MTGTATGPGGPLDLAGAVAAAGPGSLLPGRRTGEQDRPRPPLRLVAALELGGICAPGPTTGARSWAALVADARGTLLGVPLVLTGDPPATVRRAVPGDGVAVALLARLAGHRAGPLAPGFEAIALHPLVGAGERGIDVDQTHDSVLVGDPCSGGGAVVVKWAVHVGSADGDPPSVAALRHLDAVGFTRTPAPVGFLLAGAHDDRGRVLLASATRFLAGARDGWDWYVEDLLDYLDHPDRPAALASVLAPAAELGDLVAEMHAAFATPWSGCPQPVRAASGADADRWLERALDTLAEALQVTDGPAGRRLRRRAEPAEAALRAGRRGIVGAALTRVHGDLHVGQVLRWDGGYAVSDFDGNPVLPAAERAAAQPPVRDVAGMLRSLDHVGRIVDRRTQGSRSAAVRGWIEAARGQFLASYRARAGRGAGWPTDDGVLFALEVEQECRELVYAARHLSRWTYAPDAALTALLPVPGEDGER